MKDTGSAAVIALQMPPKRRGRPPRSLDAAARAQRVALDEFTAARGYLQGMKPHEACGRYLTREEPPAGEAAALKRLIGILGSIAHAANQRGGTAEQAAQASLAVAALRRQVSQADARRKDLLSAAAAERARRRHRQLAAANGAEEQGGATLEGACPLVPPSPPDAALPDHLLSIDAFAEHYLNDRGDPGWSEQEWLEALDEAIGEWRDDHPEQEAPGPLGPPPSPALLQAPLGVIAHVHLQEADSSPVAAAIEDAQWALTALEHCRFVIDRKPELCDLVDAWFTATTAERLKAAELATLRSLVAWVNRRGKTWWRKVPGLGPVRAARIDAWLQSVGVECGFPLHGDLTLPLTQVRRVEAHALAQSIPELAMLSEHRLEPLAVLLQTDGFDGRAGAFRMPGNLYGAENDIEALTSALGKYAEQPLTHRLYALEACRFALWCYRELRKPLSSVTIPDARRYREFLRNIPDDWINPDPVVRTSAAWRPFRGQLGQGSIRKALTAVHIIMGQLHEAGYLSGNPMAGVVKHAALPSPELDTTRSLTQAQWQFILEQVDRLPSARRLAALDRLAQSKPGLAEGLRALEYAKARRLAALLRLLRATGIRRDECFKARLSDISTELVDGQEDCVLRVVGKRNKARKVPLPRAVMELLRAHLADRPLAGFQDELATQAGREQIPLISVLAPPVPRRSGGIADGAGAQPGDTEHADESGALGPDGMYRVLKRFLADCAAEAGRRGLDASRFEEASTHWLRHTFGKTMMDRGADPRVVQRIMGHASLSTTAHYSRADDHESIRASRAALPDA